VEEFEECQANEEAQENEEAQGSEEVQRNKDVQSAKADLEESISLDSPVSDLEQEKSFVSLNSSFGSHVSTDYY
jgi:hypothetical protein